MVPPKSGLKKLLSLVILLLPLLCGPLLSQSEDYQKALTSYQGERYLEALVAIQKALDQDQTRASYYQLQAKILSALLQFSDAEESVRRAIELQPKLAEPHYELGLLLVRDEKLRQAATALERAVKLEPALLKARLLLGVTYMQLNLDDAALAQLKAVEKADLLYAAVHYSIGRIYFRQARDSEAIEHFRSELRTNPDHTAARFLLGKALVRVGQAEEAVDHFLALKGKEVGQALLHYFLGSAYSRLGKRTEAIEALLRSIALNPASYEARYLLARLYQQTGQSDLAQKQMTVFQKLRQRERRGNPIDAIKIDEQDPEFEEADRDSDGKLAPGEFESFVRTRVRGFEKHDVFFKGLDRNANGYLDRQEFSRRFELLGRLQGR